MAKGLSINDVTTDSIFSDPPPVCKSDVINIYSIYRAWVQKFGNGLIQVYVYLINTKCVHVFNYKQEIKFFFY